MDSILADGPSRYLPAAADIRLQDVETKVARREAWLAQLRLSALVCLSECSDSEESRSLHVPSPSPALVADPLLHLTFELEQVEFDDDKLVEVFLRVQRMDHSRPNLMSTAVETLKSVIEPVADAWRVLPGVGTDEIWSTLVSANVVNQAKVAADTGVLPAHLQQTQVKLGVQAHYTRKEQIVEASVEGNAVRALCGTWFVPTSNPETVPVCPSCKAAHEKLAV
ncbi:DUF3039 domain-containing protein [Paenarthrobacter sp. NPDC018779]|uniref:DUF3039 domain-containing protein n=1 Tax=Paenarthrobacter sp. NPDC018779 TaxID=3364375 RepID=UPI0037C8805C